MGRRRGFFAELQHQARVAERERLRAEREAERECNAAVRKAEQMRKAEERAAKQAARAHEAERKRFEKEAKEAHVAAMLAEVEHLNAELIARNEEVDSILAATLPVDDYVDLATLRLVPEHPAFSIPDLETPIPTPAEIPDPPQPVLRAAEPPKGLSRLLGRTKYRRDLAKLMLRAYNAEADNSIRSLRAGNVQTGKKRLEASRASIAKLGKMMEMRISEAFHSLRLEEIELTADYLMRKQEEREAAREERARLREEKKVAAELAAEREKLEKERKHILNTLLAVREGGGDDPELAERLRELESAIEFNDYRAANIRAGYVYVISNRGAFGEHMVKIGLTRRLEPQERVTELGGASVPFRFDVHALFFSEDAVGLEASLHQHFADRRVNRANSRKEFFFATPAEVRDVLESQLGNLLEFTERAESLEYLQSVRYWPDSLRANRKRRSDDPGVAT